MENLIEEKECRVCFGTENQDDFINPCKCSGTSKWIHKECLAQWRSLTSNPTAYTHCMECQTEYIFSAENEEVKLCEDTCLCLIKNIFPFILLNEFCIFMLSCFVILADKGSESIKALFDNDGEYSTYAPYFMFGSLIYSGIALLLFSYHFYFIKNKKLYLKYYCELGHKKISLAIGFIIIFYIFDIFLGMITLSFALSLFIRYHYLALDKINRTNNQIILPYENPDV
jgi:hypothetical protein